MSSLRVFLSQETIDTWVASERVGLLGDVVTLRPSGQHLQLVPAVHFQCAAGGAADDHDLVGKVKDQAAIDALGGEAYMTSVVLGETAYDVEPGFVATPAAGDEAQTPELLRLVAALSV